MLLSKRLPPLLASLAAFVGLYAALLFLAASYAGYDKWPSWSLPQKSIVGSRQHGFGSTLLADGSLIVATVNPDLSALEIVDTANQSSSSIPINGLLGYALSSLGDSWAIVWNERQAGHSSLWLQSEALPKTLIAQSSYFIEDVAATRDEHGNLYIAWTGGSPSDTGVFFAAQNVGSDSPTPPRQLTFGGPQDRSPGLLVHAGYMHLVYKREFVLHAEVRYLRQDLAFDRAAHDEKIGETSRETDELPLLSLDADGRAMYFWLRPTHSRGKIGQSRLIRGYFQDKSEVAAPTTLLELAGYSASLALVSHQSGAHTLAWLNNTSGIFQAYYLTTNDAGQVLTQGPVTRGGGHKFDAKVHRAARNLVLFYEMLGDDLVVMCTEDRQTAEKPIAAWFGLNPKNPFFDAFYILTSGIVGALVLTALSSLLLIPMIGLLALLSPLSHAHYIALGVTFSILLHFVAQIYGGTILLPGYMGFALMAGSAIVAWATIYFAKLDLGDLLTLGAFGHTYAYTLFFASLLF